jgi:hypothetical protein
MDPTGEITRRVKKPVVSAPKKFNYDVQLDDSLKFAETCKDDECDKCI